MSLWDAILVREPIDAMARRVVRQRQEVDAEFLTKQELCALLYRIERKQRLLKLTLGIKSRAQHKNAMLRFNKGLRQYRYEKEPKAFIEYKRLGEQAQRFIRQLQVLRTERRAKAKESEQLT